MGQQVSNGVMCLFIKVRKLSLLGIAVASVYRCMGLRSVLIAPRSCLLLRSEPSLHPEPPAIWRGSICRRQVSPARDKRAHSRRGQGSRANAAAGVPRKFRRYLWGKSTDETKASNNRRGQHEHRLGGEIAWRWWLRSCIFGTVKFAKWHGSRVENHGMQPGPSTRSGCLGWATGCEKVLSKDQHCRCLFRRAVRRKVGQVGKRKSIKSGDSDRSVWEHGRRKQASIAGLILDWRSNSFRNQAGPILDCMDWF